MTAMAAAWVEEVVGRVEVGSSPREAQAEEEAVGGHHRAAAEVAASSYWAVRVGEAAVGGSRQWARVREEEAVIVWVRVGEEAAVRRRRSHRMGLVGGEVVGSSRPLGRVGGVEVGRWRARGRW